MSKEYAPESLTAIFNHTLKSFLGSRGFDLQVFDDIFVNKLVLSTVDVHSKMSGLFRKGIDTFHYDFDLRHQACDSTLRSLLLAICILDHLNRLGLWCR